MKNKKILVTGGSGLVGKYLKDIMPNAIYLSSKDCDLRNYNQVEKLFKKYKPDVVVHLGAKIGGIISNIKYPVDYFNDNILINTNVIICSHKYNVEQFIGILSTCIFPDKVDVYPMKEEDMHLGPPTQTNFEYGYSKRCLSVQIDAYNKQFGKKWSYITPSNLYGIHDNFDNDEKAHFITALIKKINDAIKNDDQYITLYGTGRPLRQFVYAGDFARVLKMVIENNITESFNFATEENLSIYEMANIAIKVSGANHIKIAFDSTKPDGQFRKDVSIEKFKTIFPDFKITKLEDGIKKTYESFKK